MDPLQWMQWAVQTADKNITIIHTTKYAQIKQHLKAKTVEKYVFLYVNMFSIFLCERKKADGLFLWRKCYYIHILATSNGLTLKCLTNMQLLTSHNINW